MIAVFAPLHSIYKNMIMIHNCIYDNLDDFPTFTRVELELFLHKAVVIKAITDELYPHSNSIEKRKMSEIYIIGNQANLLLKTIEIYPLLAQHIFEFRKALKSLNNLINIDSETRLALDLLIELDFSYRDPLIEISYKGRGSLIGYYESGSLFSEQALSLVENKITIYEFIIYLKNLVVKPSVYDYEATLPLVLQINKNIEEFILTVELNELMKSDLL